MRVAQWMMGVVMTVLFLQCATYKGHIRRGNYDRAIEILVRKIQKGKYGPEEVSALIKAFNIAQERDLTRLSALKDATTVEGMEEKLYLLQAISSRQDLVETIIPVRAGKIVADRSTLKFYDEAKHEIQQTAQQLAQRYMVEVQKLLKSSDYRDARVAYEYLNKLEEINRISYVYKPHELRKLLDEAYKKGTVKIGVLVRGAWVPPQLEAFLLEPGVWEPIQLDWAQIKPVRDENELKNFHKLLVIDIYNIKVSPENLVSKAKTIEKDSIVDWKIIVTQSGDTLKSPVYRRFRATIEEVRQFKEAVVNARVSLVEGDRTVLSTPISVSTKFENVGYVITGDREIVPREVLAKEIKGPVPFPSDAEMVMMGADELRRRAIEFIYRNRSYFER
ncbi:MAG: hypothetical protein GXO48_09030 [Chlorobi bacterium]|nr:hypothetical protein [Chlorobiota bacterium]